MEGRQVCSEWMINNNNNDDEGTGSPIMGNYMKDRRVADRNGGIREKDKGKWVDEFLNEVNVEGIEERQNGMDGRSVCFLKHSDSCYPPHGCKCTEQLRSLFFPERNFISTIKCFVRNIERHRLFFKFSVLAKWHFVAWLIQLRHLAKGNLKIIEPLPKSPAYFLRCLFDGPLTYSNFRLSHAAVFPLLYIYGFALKLPVLQDLEIKSYALCQNSACFLNLRMAYQNDISQ
ncbi:hypothetical protein EGR_07712 [Echinococcus granulosus]|uniref:Uncharacterized protein n=1 Tax=Echinococcus granulosus TaxID=6210 RepID=W6U8Z9_ECHGR|nr:hypothetical protein EGR_07712 [Echinococcus granulosus]EUB57470.1 hypothetical protein EGR_07712 [Echinococcus granulosus]